MSKRLRAWYESEDILEEDFDMEEESTEVEASEEEETEVDVEESTEEVAGDSEDKELIDSIEDDETRAYYQEGEENLAATEGLEETDGGLDIEMEKSPEHSDDNWNISFVNSVLEEADSDLSSLGKDLAEEHGDAIANMVEAPFVTSTDENGDVVVESFDPDEMETNHTTLSKDVSAVTAGGAEEESYDDYEEMSDDDYEEEAVGYDDEDEEF